MGDDSPARRVVQQLLAGIAAGPSEAPADLYTQDAVVVLPYAIPGGLRLAGRDQIRAHFARAAASPLRMTPENITIHETTDSELVIAEYDYRVLISEGAHLTVSNVQIVRVCQGLIVGSKDFHDHVALANTLRTYSSGRAQ
jgi:uncharacterized protein (TIGR02246 family)